MTTTRRTDRTRKPPRRPPVRAAARADDPAKSSETTSGEMIAGETASDEANMAETAETSTDLEQAGTEPPVTAPAAEAGDAPEEASITEPEQEAAVGEPIEATADETESVTEEAPEEPSTEAPVVPELAAREPAEVAETGSEQAPAQDSDLQDAAPPVAAPPVDEPAADEAPAVATADDPAPAPEQPGAADREEVPLAAMQGFIEINGRLVAFLQGESQAALAFWKAALAVRSPGDLAQLQAAEMSRAVDAAIACWTDLARRMGRLPAFKAPRAHAA
jgi:hypothetical protein